MKICRLCLDQGENDLISVLDSEDDIVDKIKECVSVEISPSDDLPQTACNSCLQKIQDWFIFKDACLKSNKVLLEWKQNKEQAANCSKWEEECDYDDIKYIFEVKAEKDETQSKPGNTYTCDICCKEFNDCLDYLDHQSTHDGLPVFKCDKCGEVFTSRCELVDHDQKHKRPCPQCGKMILKNSMKLHLIKHTDRHMCSHCHSRFNSRAALHQHIITIHRGQKNHICESCGKQFSSKTAMTVHLRSHSEERSYRCKICNYAGRTSSALYVHMSTHAEEVCVCKVCSKIFKSTRNLNDHLRRVHSKEKKHQCTYCDKKFVDKCMLNVHLRCHTGVRPYVCRLCDKAFIRSDGLKEHMAIHGERIWYNCEKCRKKFASKKGITRHHCTENITI